MGKVPAVLKGRQWKLVYESDRDGSSLQQLYLKCSNHCPILIAIKETEGYTFGAYFSDRLQSNAKGFYGTGESFLFRVVGSEML